MARPNLPDGPNRSERLCISLEPRDKQALDSAARHLNTSRSEVIHRLIHQGQGAGLAVFRKE